MKNILILADGNIAKHFMEWIGRKRVAENRYDVVYYQEESIPENIASNLSLIKADPTSYAKLKHIMHDVTYAHVFIIMHSMEDALYALKNVRLIEKRVRVVLVNEWDNASIAEDEENVTILHVDELISAHLYDQLPNVPLVAQNVGLGKGDIMEVHVPFGSTYAFRHVGSILQRKWRISAIYRDEKQILPTNATMIRPNDRLLIVGKPMVLEGVYKRINRRIGLFPEPFGKSLYLILDFRFDQASAKRYVEESLFLLQRLEDKQLFIRILYPNDFALIQTLKSYESDRVFVSISYTEESLISLIEYDIQEYDIGLVLSSMDTFKEVEIQERLYALKKLVYLFGDQSLYSIQHAVILMTQEEKMESISSTALDISESLGVDLMLCDFDPEGEFASRKRIVEHYETLSHIFNMQVEVIEKVANPIRALHSMENILQIAPFEGELQRSFFVRFFSTDPKDFLLSATYAPKLLVPYALD